MNISEAQINNLVGMLDAYAGKGGDHRHGKVCRNDTLEEPQKQPEQSPRLTVRVSGYAVNFHKLTKEQQDEVISRTFHEGM